MYGPVLNKVPINSPFISDHNQCTTDLVSQLTLSITDEREEVKGTRAKYWDSKENTGDDRRGRAAVLSSGLVFLLICWEEEGEVGCGVRRPDSHQVRGPRDLQLKTPWQKAEAHISPRRKWVCVCVCVVVARSGVQGKLLPTLYTHTLVHIIY